MSQGEVISSTCFRFDDEGQRGWVQLDSVRPPIPLPCGPLRLSALNALADCFPFFINLAVQPKVRYPALVEEIKRLDPTVLGLNEVTDTLLQLLQDDPHIRSSYYFTDLSQSDRKKMAAPPTAPSMLGKHGCVLLSKIPFHSVLHISPVEDLQRRSIAGLLHLQPEDRSQGPVVLCVCTIHTIAFQMKGNVERRREQLEHSLKICRGATAELSKSLQCTDGGTVIYGDMNLHYPAEDAVVPYLACVDTWAETHFGPTGDKDPGFTFDALRNAMIPRYIPGETRQMRLDRILITQGAKLKMRSKCAIWANAPIGDPKQQINFSDHYGLTIDVELDNAPSGQGLLPTPEVDQLLKAASDIPLDKEWKVSKLRFTTRLVSHAGFLGMRAVGWK